MSNSDRKEPGAPGRTRTSTGVSPPDFESGASTSSATGACGVDNTGGLCRVNAEMLRRPLRGRSDQGRAGRQCDGDSLCGRLVREPRRAGFGRKVSNGHAAARPGPGVCPTPLSRQATGRLRGVTANPAQCAPLTCPAPLRGETGRVKLANRGRREQARRRQGRLGCRGCPRGRTDREA